MRSDVFRASMTLGVLDVVAKGLELYRLTPEQKELVLQCPAEHSTRAASRAGAAHLRRYPGERTYRPVKLLLHPRLIASAEHRDELRLTFLHEVGHLMDGVRNGRGGHGLSWREAMIKLGEPGAPTTHSLTLNAEYRKPAGRCTRCGYTWYRVRNTRRSAMRFEGARHPKCGGLVTACREA